MKKFILWFLAFIITISGGDLSAHTGPTYPKRLDVTVIIAVQELKLVRSLSLNEKS